MKLFVPGQFVKLFVPCQFVNYFVPKQLTRNVHNSETVCKSGKKVRDSMVYYEPRHAKTCLPGLQAE